MTLGQALAQAAARGLVRLDAQLLLLHTLGRTPQERDWLLAHDTDALPPDTQARFDSLCRRRQQGEPVAYLLGRKEFFALDLAVDARVLVPRPETEILVEWALTLLPEPGPSRVLDLGTGSGAIALALKRHRPGAEVHATDRSGDALAVAAANAAALGLDVRFGQGSWLQGVRGPFDLVASNPPYVAEGDAHLAALAHEPLAALVAGPDGLDDIRIIAAQAPACLTAGGWLLLEHGWDQAEAVRQLLRSAGLRQVQSRRDLAGIERCSGGRRGR